MKTLRLIISALFSILVFLPLLFISSNLSRQAEHKFSEALADAKERLVDEVNSFKRTLIPRFYIEDLIKSGETQVGLTFATSDKPVFARNVDPELITASTNEQLRDFYKSRAGLTPLVQVAFSVDCHHIWSWFAAQLSHLSADDRRMIASVLAVYAIDFDSPSTLTGGWLYPLKNYFQAYNTLGSKYTGFSSAMLSTFYKYFSDIAYVPNNQGICYEMCCNDFASRYLYCYYRAINEGNITYGGYFIIFASADLKVANIARDSLSASDKSFSRQLLVESRYPVNRMLSEDNELRLVSNVPTELFGYNVTTGENYPLPRYLEVSLSLKDMRQAHARRLQQIASVSRSCMLAAYMLSVYFLFFGFPHVFRLRLQILAVTALVILLPYAVLGYFCLSLLDSAQSLEKYELKADADSLMYRIRSYFIDQKLQFALHTLKAKDRLTRIVGKPAEELTRVPANRVVNSGSDVNLAFYRTDGVDRYFKDRNPGGIIPRVDAMLAVKFLDNLDVLQKDSRKVREMLDQVVLADGFIDTLRREYEDHNIMQHEAVETVDLRKADNFSRMIYYLIPDANDPDYRVRAMALSSISNSGYMLINPEKFSNRIYSDATPFARHSFAIGQRRVNDTVLRWWPTRINPDARIKRLLDIAADTGSSGFRAKVGADGGIFEHYHFENDLSVVISGVSQSYPDLLMQLLVSIFPLLLLAVIVTSLFLFADILAVLFINPVRGFQAAAGQIGAGNWQTRVEIVKTDEFSQLADSFNRMALGLAQREKMRRFVSEDLYQQLGQRILSEEPRLTQVSLLASDIRGFTSLSEKTDPQQVVSLLNDYFTEMESAITSCGGFVERLVGDAVIAVFYPGDKADNEERAARAAWRMRLRLAQLNRRRAEVGLFVVDNGIGIATGQVFSGMAGSQSGRRVFSVIGEVTQRAEKIESLTRTISSRILLCPETAGKLDARCKITDVTAQTGIAAFALDNCEDIDG